MCFSQERELLVHPDQGTFQLVRSWKSSTVMPAQQHLECWEEFERLVW